MPNIITGWDMQGPSSDNTIFRGSSTQGRGFNRDDMLRGERGQGPQVAPDRTPAPRVPLPGPRSDIAVFAGSNTNGRGFSRDQASFVDPLDGRGFQSPLSALVVGEQMMEAPSGISTFLGSSTQGRGILRESDLNINVPPTLASSGGLGLLIPADMLPTLLQWGGIGLIGVILIIVGAEVSGAVQQELGPGGIMGLFGLGGR